MRGFVAILLLFVGLTACQSSLKSSHEWESFEADFLKDLWSVYPQWAFSLGRKESAGIIKIPGRASWVEQKEFLMKHQQRLTTLSEKKMSPEELTDYALVKSFIESTLWNLDVLKDYEWDASLYNLGSPLNGVLEAKNMTGSERLQALQSKLAVVPAYYKAALEQLQNPTREHLTLAIQQNRLLADHLEKSFLDQTLDLATTLEQKKELRLKIKNAAQAVRTYVSSLEYILKHNKKFRDFRLGEELYAKKFKYDLQSRFTAREIYEKALLEKQKTLREMTELAKKLWTTYFPGKLPPIKNLEEIHLLITEISKKHTQADQFVATVRAQIPQLWNFVESKKLLKLDPQQPLVVRETPVYERGFAGASVNAPGPFDETRETFYQVTPLDGMSPEKKESYLREYNDYTLQILNIHEAIPGHYTQLVYSRRSPSLIKQVLGSGTMIEGWAVYAERMMMEEGYNNKPEMWLMYHKWRLRVISNTILDYSIHNLNMSREQALQMLIKEAFQEKAEAEEKWNRATYSQVQLASYFTGFTEIYEFREELKKRMGSQFQLEKFHEDFLSYGSAPVQTIRSLMLAKIPKG